MNIRFPFHDPFDIAGEPFAAQEIVDTIGPLVTPARRARIKQVVGDRTCTIAPVMEGLYDRGNISAVLRSCEAMGFLPVHLIQLSKEFKPAKRATQGAEKWLHIDEWSSTAACVEQLRVLGYRIVATHFTDARPIDTFDFTQPIALVFGNEKDGVSPEMLEAADDRLVIPMAGFVQSYNISVAAALSLYHISQARRRALGHHGDLSEAEQCCLTAEYYLRTVPTAVQILLRTRQDMQPTP